MDFARLAAAFVVVPGARVEAQAGPAACSAWPSRSPRGEVHGHDDPIRGAASRPGRTASGVGRAPPASEPCPDLIVAAQDATFGLTEVTFGLVPPEEGIVRLPERIPRNIALEILLTGDPLPAERALQLGLVNHLTPAGETLAKALELAHRIARNAPLSIAAVKRAVTERAAYGDQDAFRQQDQLVAPVLASHDAQEGAHAFAEKRPPHREGR